MADETRPAVEESFVIPEDTGGGEDFHDTSDVDPRLLKKATAAKGEGRDWGQTVGKLAEAAIAGVPEAAWAGITGMVGKAAGDVAGLATIPFAARQHAAGEPETIDPAQVKQDVQSALTYEPRTEPGKAMVESKAFPLNWPGAVVGPIAEKAKTRLTEAGHPIAGAGVEEALLQMPGVVGGRTKVGEPAKAAGLATAERTNAVADATRERVQRAGFITPAETGPKATMSGWAKTNEHLSDQNEIHATKLATRAAGIKEGDAISPEALEKRLQEEYKHYDAVVANAYKAQTRQVPSTHTAEWEMGTQKPEIVGLESTKNFENGIRAALRRGEQAQAAYPEQYRYLNESLRLLREQLYTPEDLARRTSLENALQAKREQLHSAPTAGEFGRAQRELRIIENDLKEMDAKAKLRDHDPKQALDNIKNLRSTASKALRNPNLTLQEAEVAYTKKLIAAQLEVLFEENLYKQPELMRRFKQARQNIAKLNDIEDATSPQTGRVDIQTMRKLGETRPLSGELKDIADFGAAYEKASQRVKGAAPPITRFDLIIAGGALAAGHPLVAAAELGGRWGIPWAARKGWLQQKTPEYKLSPARTATTSALTMSGAEAAATEERKRNAFTMGDIIDE